MWLCKSGMKNQLKFSWWPDFHPTLFYDDSQYHECVYIYETKSSWCRHEGWENSHERGRFVAQVYAPATKSSMSTTFLIHTRAFCCLALSRSLCLELVVRNLRRALEARLCTRFAFALALSLSSLFPYVSSLFILSQLSSSQPRTTFLFVNVPTCKIFKLHEFFANFDKQQLKFAASSSLHIIWKNFLTVNYNRDQNFFLVQIIA